MIRKYAESSTGRSKRKLSGSDNQTKVFFYRVLNTAIRAIGSLKSASDFESINTRNDDNALDRTFANDFLDRSDSTPRLK